MYYVEIAVLSHVYAHVKHKHIETEKHEMIRPSL